MTDSDGKNRLSPTRSHARVCEGYASDASLSVTSVTVRVRQLARDLSRLSPDWRNPERYFENRSEIEHALRRLARQLEENRV